MINRERVLVLGANGFIASHLIDSLLSYGYVVRAFARFDNGLASSSSPDIEIYRGDFLNQTDIERALKDVSYVVHLISTTTPATSDKDPLMDLHTNVIGTVTFLQKCVLEKKIKKVIFASSGGTVYGDNYPGRPFKETDSANPISPYGIGKLTIENYLHYFNRSRDLDFTIFRISNPYGGRQKINKQQGIMPILVRHITSQQPFTIYGDGTMVRDYIYIYDLVDIIAKSINTPLRHKVYNIGSGMGLSINELVAVVEEVVGKKALIENIDSPSTFVHTSILDNSRLLQEIPTDFTTIYEGVHAIYSDLQLSANP